MTVINIVNGSMGIVNDDVLFWDDDKEVILVELWAQMKQQVKNIRDQSKRSQTYRCLFEFRSKSSERTQIPVSVVSRFLPKHVVAQLPYVFAFFAK